MDSGIAKESFNIISQGKIDSILSSKPEDRRVVFEEAAGVIKYKKRKEEAFKRMEKTKINMERISDIINELENQLEPLRDQKIKAEAYIKYSDELKELEISLITTEIKVINDRYQANKDKIESLKKEIIELSTINSTNESKATLFKSKINDIDLKIKNSQEELFKLITKVEKLNSEKQILNWFYLMHLRTICPKVLR